MIALMILFALAAQAQQSGLDMIRPEKPAPVVAAPRRAPLNCKDAASIRGFKAAVVEGSGWEHRLADEWARCACPKQSYAAGWPKPRPVLPEAWGGSLPGMIPSDHAGNVKRLADSFLFEARPLPITRKQAENIADCWYRSKANK